MSVTHELKIWPEYYEAVVSGLKTFEVREADRDFKVDDILHLREWNPETRHYTGRDVLVNVTYILEDWLYDQVIMSIVKTERGSDEEYAHVILKELNEIRQLKRMS